MKQARRRATSQPRRKLATDTRLFLLVLSSVLPFLGFWALSARPLSTMDRAALLLASLLWILIVAVIVRQGVLRHIRTLSNLVEATRTRDFGLKSSWARERGELAELYQQVNLLTDSLKVGSQGEQELLNILEKIVSQINVAIIVCDFRDKIRLLNPLAGSLLRASMEELIGVDFAKTVLAEVSFTSEPRLLDHRFPGGEGRWQVSQQYYRHQGKPSRILFIIDLKEVLSDEQIAAWQRLIRVMSHEVNNSLTPIMSLCQTLTTILNGPDSAECAGDVRDGLRVIGDRAKGLKGFITAYARIARLPEPDKISFPAEHLVEKVKGIFRQDPLQIIEPIPDFRLFGDPVHLEQALINLIRNALEATGEGAPPVRFSCRLLGDQCEFEIVDSGAGISNPGNLFVPFYTPKKEGAGIGLVLCRQIAVRHYGQATLENRTDGHGAIARLILPVSRTTKAR